MSALKVPTVFTAIDKVSKVTKKMAGSVSSFAQKSEASVARAQRKVRSFNKSLGGITGSMNGVQRAFMGAFAVMGGSQIITSISNMQKLQSNVKTLFDTTDKEAEATATKIEIISSKFEEQEEAVLQAANAVTKQMGVGYQEALGIIEQGFTKGANVQGEFLDQLKEYPVQFKELGLNAKQAVAVITQSQQQGVFSDKGVDTIKEAGIALREMPKVTQEAVNALFDSSTAADELSERLDTGQTTMFEEIQRISAKMAEADSRTKGMVLADVFKGAGEDAVSFVDGLANVNTNLDKTESQMTPFRENWLKMIEIFTQVKNTLLSTLVPVLVQLFKKLEPVGQWMIQNKGTIQALLKVVLVAAAAFVTLKITLFAVSSALKIAQFSLAAYNVVTGITTALTGGSAMALRGSRAALIGYSIAAKAVTAVQWAWNAAMSANPIGLIIAAIAALIGLIVAIIVKWEEWGAAVSLFMGPVGMVISLFMELKKRWDDITKAFSDGGILAGLKMIGKTILSALLMPVEQLLGAIGKIPGMDFAAEAAANMNNFREGLFEDEEGEQETPQEEVPNTNRSQFNMIQQTNTNNARVDLNVNDDRGAADVQSDSDMVNINRGQTFSF